MEQTAFDIFQSVKTLLYLGDYHKACEEASSTDINEEDLSQIVKKHFYYFISCVEDQKNEELNAFLQSLKSSQDKQIKIYYNLFLFFVIYIYKGQFNEQKFMNLYNDLKDVKRYDATIFPAIYIISLMLLDRKEYENFLKLIEKFECDMEILALKFYMLFHLNKVEEMEKIINTMNIKEQDSVLTQICSILFRVYVNNDYDYAIEMLQQINKNQKICPKMFNFIGLSLMSKGGFEEALRILNLGKEACEKIGNPSRDYNCILVNMICCYRNLNNENELRNTEENLRKNDPKNEYFLRLNNFEAIFAKLTS